MLANSEDPDQTPQPALSDLGLHCLPMSYAKDARHIWFVCFTYKGSIIIVIEVNFLTVALCCIMLYLENTIYLKIYQKHIFFSCCFFCFVLFES